MRLEGTVTAEPARLPGGSPVGGMPERAHENAQRRPDERRRRRAGLTDREGFLFTRIANIWRPQNFHLQHRLGGGAGHFEGWYFKLVDAAGDRPASHQP